MLQARAARLVAGFAKHTRTGLPFVTLKMAASLDGKVAARDGSSRWITGEAAREDAHRLRAASGAIVVGAGTAVTDGPSLTVRLSGYRGRQPLRVLVDGSGRVPAGGPLFDGTASTLVATTPAGAERAGGGWEAAGAEVLTLDGPAEDRVSLARLMEALGKREIQNVLIEGGPTLAWSAAQEGLIDRIVVYLAPKLIGGAATPGILGGDGVENIADAIALTLCDVAMVGEDLRIESMTNGVEEGTA
jgi:diaminohydroxyphosphoribosylaminopyrimidine deaminase/5-amino-6-(5-phosphoribosylamino)uracil reductase